MWKRAAFNAYFGGVAASGLYGLVSGFNSGQYDSNLNMTLQVRFPRHKITLDTSDPFARAGTLGFFMALEFALIPLYPLRAVSDMIV